MKIRKVAVIIFYDENKRILLQDRRNMSKVGEEWGFFGGEIKNTETPEECLLREIKEELNFDLKDFKYIGEYKAPISENTILDLFVFISPLKNKLSKFKQDEGRDMKLFTLDETEKLKITSVDKIIVKSLKKILGDYK